jgi:hypothetical protein
MGVDIFLRYQDMPIEEIAKQYDRFVTMGINGYLKGNYKKGSTDALKELFYWADWDYGRSKMDIKTFKRELEKIKLNDGKITYEHEYMDENFDERQIEPLDPQEIKEYEDFLKLAKKWNEEGKDIYLLIRW